MKNYTKSIGFIALIAIIAFAFIACDNGTTNGGGKESQAAPTGLGKTDCTTAANNDGTITGVTTAMEYKLSTASSYIACTGTTVTGLANGTYHVRYAETTTHNASPNATVTIAAYTGNGDPCAGGHDFTGTWTTKTPATATEDGEEETTCTRIDCNEKDTRFSGEYATGTAGLAFEAIDTTAYRVRKGTVTTGAVHIPAFHRPSPTDDYLPVTEIGASTDTNTNGAFQGTTINAITFAANSQLSVINTYAFYTMSPPGTVAFTTITIPASVTTIGAQAFRNCTQLATLIFAEGSQLTSTANYSFSVPNLTSVTVHAGVSFGTADEGTRWRLFMDYYNNADGEEHEKRLAGTYTWSGTAWTGPAAE